MWTSKLHPIKSAALPEFSPLGSLMQVRHDHQPIAGLPECYGLPLLRKSLESWQPNSKYHVLDFGPVQRQLVTQIQSRAGLLRVLDVTPEDLSGANFSRWLRTHLDTTASQRYELVLAWDLLNYFSSTQLQLLDEALANLVTPTVQLHALIRYSKPDMPSAPDRFLLLDDRTVQHSARVTEQMKAPRYSPKALEKWMPHFKADRTRLLGNGMQEYLLQLQR